MRLTTGVIGPAAVLAFAVSSAGCFESQPPAAGFWYEEASFVLPADVEAALGGRLEAGDIRRIKEISLAEVTRAFSGVRVLVTSRQRAAWRVAVVEIVPRLGALPSAGQSFSLGVLGGTGSVGFVTLAMHAIQHAPPSTSRQAIVDGIGRGIGRAAAHEFAHQILGSAMQDDRSNVNAYEYFSSDRRAQYYGELRWTSAWSLLHEKLGG